MKLKKRYNTQCPVCNKSLLEEGPIWNGTYCGELIYCWPCRPVEKIKSKGLKGLSALIKDETRK